MYVTRPRFYGIVFFLSLFFYSISAGVTLFHQSIAPHYVYLSHALLHGHADLNPLSPTTYDLLFFQNHWYVAGSPMPAFLLMPLVALGNLNVSDIFFGVLIGAVNVTLMYDLIGRLLTHPNFPQQSNNSLQRWLTVLFAAGTVHWYVASLGSVWFNAHVVAVTFMLLYVREVLATESRDWLAGGWLALAFLARPTTLFGASFFVVYRMVQDRDWRSVFRRSIPFSLMIGAGISVLLVYNQIRFGQAMDFGYGYVQGAANITETFAQYGGFSWRFLPCNLYVSLAGVPDIAGRFSPIAGRLCHYLLPDGPPSVPNTWLLPNPLGMSIFLTTPALIYIFRTRLRNSVTVAAWIGLLSISLPLWMYHNTGSLQFGYRYSLDTVPFWMILVAAGMDERFGRLSKSIIILSVLINFLGMMWMFQAFNGFSWLTMWNGNTT